MGDGDPPSDDANDVTQSADQRDAQDADKGDDEPTLQELGCIEVKPAIVKSIGTGLKKKTGAKLSGPGYAVRSDDFEKVWMVGVELDGPGLEEPGDVAVWATNGDPRGSVGEGLIIRANGLAAEFSTWGAAAQPGSSADFTAADHGVAEAENCLASVQES